MYYELDRNFVQVSGSCGPQSARAQFIVDAQTVTRILSREYRTAGWVEACLRQRGGCITKTAGEIIETRQALNRR